MKGVLVDINDIIKGFNKIIDGDYDYFFEVVFNFVGIIEDVVVKGEKLIVEVVGK